MCEHHTFSVSYQTSDTHMHAKHVEVGKDLLVTLLNTKYCPASP
jgi:hypothetical protein